MSVKITPDYTYAPNDSVWQLEFGGVNFLLIHWSHLGWALYRGNLHRGNLHHERVAFTIPDEIGDLGAQAMAVEYIQLCAGELLRVA